ncbi:MAG: LTA synthase family protein [Lachnospiraceae bacterium]
MQKKLNLNWKTIKMFLCALLIPAINFYLLEFYTHNGFVEVRPWAQLFNIVLYELMLLFLFFLTRSLRVALRIETVFSMLFGLVNYYVYTFRSLPLVPWDLFSFKTAASVAGNYNFLPEPRVIVVIACFVLLFIAEHFLNYKLKQHAWSKTVLGAIMAAVVLISFSVKVQAEDFQNSHRLYNKLFTPVYMWQVNGLVLTFVMDLPFLTIDKPDGYSVQEAKEVLETYEEDTTESAAHSVYPNIIAVMNESFSDLAVLGDFTASQDYMPFFHQMEQGADNTMTGYLNVSVLGGNTPNTEFEFLTGNSMAFLPQGSIPYQQYITQSIPALPEYLRTLGYATYAMHPYYASGWSRETVYPLLGFDASYFIKDYYGAEYVRNYISDKSSVDKIIEVYENKQTGEPAFIFNVTMQNHGGYYDKFDNFTPDITVENSSSYSLSSYLSLIKLTDESLRTLVSYFSLVEEPTVIVFFGDHQPSDSVAEPILALNGMSYKTLTEEETKNRYKVPFMIWANYDIQEAQHIETSVNYLSSVLLSAAGVPKTDYQSFLSEHMELYPVISAQRIVNSAGEDVLKSEVQEELSTYQKLQYYQIFDVQEEE